MGENTNKRYHSKIYKTRERSRTSKNNASQAGNNHSLESFADSHFGNIANSGSKSGFYIEQSDYRQYIMHLQRTIGNRAVERLWKSGYLQAKLGIGQVNDKYEQEADQVAQKVVSMDRPQTTQPVEDEKAQSKIIQRESKPEENEKAQTKFQRAKLKDEEVLAKNIQRKESQNAPFDVESVVLSKSGGKPLSTEERSYFEPRFRTDFSGVKLHTGTQANEMANSINAKAFTYGRDIYFGSGQYNPRTTDGKKLMAHELTHTVQQGGEGITPQVKRKEKEDEISQTDLVLTLKVKPGEGLNQVIQRALKYSNIADVNTKRFESIVEKVAKWNGVVPNKLKQGQAIEIPKSYLKPQQNYDNVTIKPRKEWGAKEPKLGKGRSYERVENIEKEYDSIVIHHSGNKGLKTMSEVQEEHMSGDDPRADIGYHYGINLKGEIFEGRSINIKGSHVAGGNTGKIGIVLLADLDTKDEGLSVFENMGEWSDDKLTKKMEKSIIDLIMKLKSEFPLLQFLGGHKEYDTRRFCPGDLVMNVINSWRSKAGMKKPKPVQ